MDKEQAQRIADDCEDERQQLISDLEWQKEQVQCKISHNTTIFSESQCEALTEVIEEIFDAIIFAIDQ